MNNTKRFSPGEGEVSLKLVAMEIELRPFFPDPVIHFSGENIGTV